MLVLSRFEVQIARTTEVVMVALAVADLAYCLPALLLSCYYSLLMLMLMLI